MDGIAQFLLLPHFFFVVVTLQFAGIVANVGAMEDLDAVLMKLVTKIRVSRDCQSNNMKRKGKMKKHVIFFEARGGSDKGPDGHRRDTMPMVNAVKAQGWEAEVIFYADEKKDEIFDYVVATADAYVSRINPGNIPGGEETYFDMLRALCDAGVVGMPHPDAMIGYDIPLIWTADFMLDWDENMQDKYILGEINCSCVGFTSHLEHGIQEKVAAQIIETVAG